MNLNMDTVNGDGNSLVIINDGKPGLVDNITMTQVETGESSNGSGFIKFTFEDENGGKVSHFEFDIKPTDENVENRTNSQLKRLKHIVTKYVPEGTQLPQAQSFPEMYTKLSALLTSVNYASVKLRGKLVYNAKDYLSLPKYVPFLESMQVPVEETRLKIKSIEDGGIDKMTKSANDDPSSLAAPLPMPGAPVGSIPGLPANGGTGAPGVPTPADSTGNAPF